MEQPTIEYTPLAQQALRLGEEQARAQGAAHLEPHHILWGILYLRKRNNAHDALHALNHDPDALAQVLQARLPSATAQPPGSEAAPARNRQREPLPPSAAGNLALSAAMKETRHLAYPAVDVVHLLLGLLYTDPTDRTRHHLAYQVLNAAGVSLVDVRHYVLHNVKRPRGAGSIRGKASVSVWAQIRPSPTFLALLAVMLASGAGLYVAGESTSNLARSLSLLFVVSGWIISVCVHEFGHAVAAYLGGDYAVADAGYLSLNPLKYTHPLMSIALPIVFLLLGGLGLPGGAVYINSAALRSPRWEIYVAAAGPLGTLIFALLLSIPFWVGVPFGGGAHPAFWTPLAFLGFLQITALMFNLLPIPPLDGFRMLAPFLPPDLAAQMWRYSTLLFFLLLFILWQGGPLTNAFWGEAFRAADSLGFPLELVWRGFEQIRL